MTKTDCTCGSLLVGPPAAAWRHKPECQERLRLEKLAAAEAELSAVAVAERAWVRATIGVTDDATLDDVKLRLNVFVAHANGYGGCPSYAELDASLKHAVAELSATRTVLEERAPGAAREVHERTGAALYLSPADVEKVAEAHRTTSRHLAEEHATWKQRARKAEAVAEAARAAWTKYGGCNVSYPPCGDCSWCRLEAALTAYDAGAKALGGEGRG